MNLYLRNTLVAIGIIALWAWVAADDWQHELELEQTERARIRAIHEYHQSKLSSAQSEDSVDTTPVPTPEPEPTYISAPVKTAKRALVKTKHKIKKSVKR